MPGGCLDEQMHGGGWRSRLKAVQDHDWALRLRNDFWGDAARQVGAGRCRWMGTEDDEVRAALSGKIDDCGAEAVADDQGSSGIDGLFVLGQQFSEGLIELEGPLLIKARLDVVNDVEEGEGGLMLFCEQVGVGGCGCGIGVEIGGEDDVARVPGPFFNGRRVGPDDEDGTIRLAIDRFGVGAEEDACDAGTSVGAEDDQVGLLLDCSGLDFFVENSGERGCFSAEAEAAEFCAFAFELLLIFFGGGELIEPDDLRWRDRIDWLTDVGEYDAGVVKASNTAAIINGALGDIGEIDGNKNAFELSFCRHAD